MPTSLPRSRILEFSQTPWRTWIVLAALALVARLPRLGRSLWYDEVYYSTQEKFTSWQQLFGALWAGLEAPLYRILLFAWTSLFGEDEIVVRLPSLAFALLSIILAYELARRYATPQVAIAVGLWLSLSPVHVWYSREATPYAMVSCLVLATALCAQRIADRGGESWGQVVAYFGLLVGAVYTHYYAAVILAPLSLLAWSATDRACRRILWINLAVAVSFSGVVLKMLADRVLQEGQGFLRPFTLFEAWMLGGQYFLHGNSLWTFNPYTVTLRDVILRPGLFVVQLLAAVLVAMGIWRSSRGVLRAAGLVPVAFLVALPVALWCLTQLGFNRLYIERYAFWALPFYAFFLVRGALEWNRPLVRWVLVTAAIALAGAGSATAALETERWTIYKQNSDWRAAALEVMARSSGPQRTQLVGVKPVDPIRYHLRRLGWFLCPKPVLATAETVDSVPLAGHTVFLVEDLNWNRGVVELRDRLDHDARLRLTHVSAFRGVKLYEYSVLTSGP